MYLPWVGLLSVVCSIVATRCHLSDVSSGIAQVWPSADSEDLSTNSAALRESANRDAEDVVPQSGR